MRPVLHLRLHAIGAEIQRWEIPKMSPAIIIPMAVDTRAEPNTLPTTVGIDEKKPPFIKPFRTAKTANGARVVEAGQRASIAPLSLEVLRRYNREGHKTPAHTKTQRNARQKDQSNEMIRDEACADERKRHEDDASKAKLARAKRAQHSRHKHSNGSHKRR
ncbi:hypothetical protein HG530_006499 [Fusarium avenaceum]|nr:hypothetical protein HG530_006499 [Fusarium avenaceum]